MKATLKKMALALVIGVLACLCLVGCGAISMDEIKGEWTVDTINGQSIEDYAASIGMTAGNVVTNWTIKDDKTLVSENITGATEFDMELKSNGFELKQKGKSEIFCSVAYDKDAKTLTYEIKDTNGTMKTVMKKGKGEIEMPGQAAATDDSSEAESDDSTEATDDSDDSSDDSEATEGDEESDDSEGEEVEDESGDEEETE